MTLSRPYLSFQAPPVMLQKPLKAWNGLGGKEPLRPSHSIPLAMDRELSTRPGCSKLCPPWPWMFSVELRSQVPHKPWHCMCASSDNDHKHRICSIPSDAGHGSSSWETQKLLKWRSKHLCEFPIPRSRIGVRLLRTYCSLVIKSVCRS